MAQGIIFPGSPIDKRVVSERDLTSYVRDLAKVLGWRRYHTWLAKHSPAGFPDEVLVRKGRLIFAELKSEKGKVSPAQEEWLDDLTTIAEKASPPCPDCETTNYDAATVEVYVWRPSDMDEIARVLR